MGALQAEAQEFHGALVCFSSAFQLAFILGWAGCPAPPPPHFPKVVSREFRLGLFLFLLISVREKPFIHTSSFPKSNGGGGAETTPAIPLPVVVPFRPPPPLAIL